MNENELEEDVQIMQAFRQDIPQLENRRRRCKFICLMCCTTMFPAFVLAFVICGDVCRIQSSPLGFYILQFTFISLLAIFTGIASIQIMREFYGH